MENLPLAYGLILFGLLLLVADLFLLSGFVFVLGITAVAIGVVLTFQHSSSQGLVTLIVLFIIVPVVGPLIVHYAPRTKMGRRLFLSGPQEDATVASMPVHLELEQLRGRYGRTVSSLRPAGTVEFDGRRVDVISEGTLVDPGQWVRCIDVKSSRVIVRQVDRPPDLGDFEPTELNT